jgi:hypothetical protein
MNDDARERQGHGGEQHPEEGHQRAEERYESPRVDDIPLDRPAATAPGANGALSEGSPDLLL